MVTLKINLAAIVLAKTLSSLNHCQNTGKGTWDVVYNCFFFMEYQSFSGMKDFWIAWDSMILVLEDEKNCRIATKRVG